MVFSDAVVLMLADAGLVASVIPTELCCKGLCMWFLECGNSDGSPLFVETTPQFTLPPVPAPTLELNCPISHDMMLASSLFSLVPPHLVSPLSPACDLEIDLSVPSLGMSLFLMMHLEQRGGSQEELWARIQRCIVCGSFAWMSDIGCYSPPTSEFV